MPTCTVCKGKIVRDVLDSVVCSVCHGVFHAKCLQMSKEDLEGYLNLTPALRDMWKCKMCHARRMSFMREEGNVGNVEPTPGNSVTPDKVCLDAAPSTLADMLKYFEKRFDRIDEYMKEMRNMYSTVTHDVALLQEKSITIEKRVSSLEHKQNVLECCDLNAIEIHGLPNIGHGERYIAALELFKAMDLVVDDKDLDECTLHRKKWVKKVDVGAASSGKTSHEAVQSLLIVRFTTRRVREMVLQHWREMRRNGTSELNALGVSGLRLAVNERMCRATRELFYRTKSLAKHCGWSYVWMRRGKVFIREKEGDKPIILNSIEDLDTLSK